MSATFLDNINQLAQTLCLSSPSCNYYSDSEFLSASSRLDTKNYFKIFHMNIRSLNANNAKLFQYIAALNFPFDAMILSEIWSFNISLYTNLFPEYTFFHVLPSSSAIGGIGIFVKKTLMM